MKASKRRWAKMGLGISGAKCVIEKRVKEELRREETVAEIRRQGSRRPGVDIKLPVFHIRVSKTPFIFLAQRTTNQFNAHLL